MNSMWIVCIHKGWLESFDKVLCLHLWALIGSDRRGKFAVFNVKAKENEALFLRVSLNEYLLPVLDGKCYLLLMYNYQFGTSLQWDVENF